MSFLFSFLFHVISIHAPRERSDGIFLAQGVGVGFISIHAPRERSDSMLMKESAGLKIFQSTLLVRGATAIL